MEPVIIDHNHPEYRKIHGTQNGRTYWNGAFYYSKEITENIIPRIRTNRNWITINVPDCGVDHAIVFIHNNLNPEKYEWLKRYEDLILVCGIPETVSRVSHIGTAIYLPLSVDVDHVLKYRIPEDRREINTAFVGRPSKRTGIRFPRGTVFLEGMARDSLLRKMAMCRNVYAVGRTAIEAKILGCNVLPYDPRFPDPARWKIVDNIEAAALLQRQLNEIDGVAEK